MKSVNEENLSQETYEEPEVVFDVAIEAEGQARMVLCSFDNFTEAKQYYYSAVDIALNDNLGINKVELYISLVNETLMTWKRK